MNNGTSLDLGGMFSGLQSQLDAQVRMATGMSLTFYRIAAFYALAAGILLLGYKLFVVYSTLRRTSDQREVPDLLRVAVHIAVILVLPYGLGAWIVDTISLRSRFRVTVTTIYVTLILLGGYLSFFMMRLSNKLDFSIPTF